MLKEIKDILLAEKERQKRDINLIASENYISKEMLELHANYFTNKYAEGYPEKRYYQGCENVDLLEKMALEEVCRAFHCQFANIQPHSGSQANQAVLAAFLQPGDSILSLDLKSGGHLSHGFKNSYTGKIYRVTTYEIDENGEIDYVSLEKGMLNKPKLVFVGYSACTTDINYEKIRNIIGDAILVADISHISGLIVAGLLNNPFPFADVITSTTHKTLNGPKGAIILWNNEILTKKINSAVFPGIQGGPILSTLPAKLLCFQNINKPEFIDYAKQIIKNSQKLYEELKNFGLNILYQKTSNHIVLWKLDEDAKNIANILEKNNIIVNANFLRYDQKIATGIRLGSVAMTTRGLKEDDFSNIAKLIFQIYQNDKKDIFLYEKILSSCYNNDKNIF